MSDSCPVCSGQILSKGRLAVCFLCRQWFYPTSTGLNPGFLPLSEATSSALERRAHILSEEQARLLQPSISQRQLEQNALQVLGLQRKPQDEHGGTAQATSGNTIHEEPNENRCIGFVDLPDVGAVVLWCDNIGRYWLDHNGMKIYIGPEPSS
ncbi:hypothetical protein BT69DRAFT_1386001 [Atractiella rhizophila]|nr:hypothetical protein BT69DRAFT_1386001 [Atractiella rhizophila]